ncbi:hypothetical protein FRB90_001282, partial [Tulasnella sp. 427]
MAEVDLTPTADEPMFDPSLKKKKKPKKQVVFNEEPAAEPPKETRDPSPVPTPGPSILKPSSEEAAEAPAAEAKKEKAGATPDDFGFGDLKKKKKKIPMDFGDGDAGSPAAAVATPTEEGVAPADDLNDFSDIKKKKKKSTKKLAFDIDAFEKELGEGAATPKGEDGAEAGEVEEADLGEDVFAMPAAPVDVGDETETWHGTDRDYTYSEMLGRIVKTLRAQNPDLSAGGRKRYTIVPPSIHREGNKKTIFAN